jgi:hypothetical protein
MSVVNNIREACDALGQVDLSGIPLEEANPQLLNVSAMELDQHVAMQPAAIAYYGSILKEASRRVAAHKRAYDRWQKKGYAIAKAALTGQKATVADIEARYIVDNEPEIEKWEAQAEKLQMEYDNLNVWYEAWRQKSFSIREFVGITDDERYNSNPSSYGGKGESQENNGTSPKLQKVRDIMRKKREGNASSAAQ